MLELPRKYTKAQLVLVLMEDADVIRIIACVLFSKIWN